MSDDFDPLIRWPDELPRLPGDNRSNRDRALDPLRAALRGVRNGRVTVVVQDGVIIQIERTTRVRIPRPRP
jgi:hypothetical protein